MSTQRPRQAAGYFSLVNQLRGIAALLVVWDHLVGEWLERHALDWGPDTLVTRFVTGPLNLIQHTGFLGVALFFLISGFVVTRAGSLEPGWTFVVRRVLRIYPPLVAAVLLSVGTAYVLHRTGLGSQMWEQLSPAALLKAMTLATYVSVPQVVIVAVAWTLVIEVVFYALVWATAPLLKGSLPDLLAPVAILTLLALVALLDRSLGDAFFLLSVSASYVPILVLGQVVFLVTQRGASVLAGAGVAVGAWVVLVWSLERTQPGFLTPAQSYGSSLSVALAGFVAAVLAERRVRPAAWLDLVARRSYSLYLTHGIVGVLVLDVAWSRGVIYRWALLLALVAVAIATELMYRFVETPSITLARRLTRGRPAGVAQEALPAASDAAHEDAPTSRDVTSSEAPVSR